MDPVWLTAHFPAKFFYIKDLDVDDIPVADYVVVRRQACPSRKKARADAVIGLLRRFENGPAVRGWTAPKPASLAGQVETKHHTTAPRLAGCMRNG